MKILLDGHSVGLVIFNAKFKVLYTSPWVQNFLGITPGNNLRKVFNDRLVLLSRDLQVIPAAENPFVQAVETTSPVREFVAGLFTSQTDGIQWIKLEVSPLETKTSSRKSPRFLAVLLNHSSPEEFQQPLMLLTSPDFNILEVNKTLLQLLGTPAKNVIGKSWLNRYVPEEVHQPLKEACKQTQDQNVRLKYPLQISTDSPITLYWQIRFRFNEQGKCTGVVHIGTQKRADAETTLQLNEYRRELERLVQERTARLRKTVKELEKEVEKHNRTANKLKESETLFRYIFESMNDGILLIDQDGKILLANQKISELFGYNSSELKGKPIEILVPETIQHIHRKERQSYLKNATMRVMGKNQELTARRKDGTNFLCSVTLSPIYHENRLLVAAIVRDVSEQIAAERAIKESVTLYRSLFEEASIPLIEADLSKVIVRLKSLQNQGIEDLRTYLDENPTEFKKVFRLLKVKNVNRQTLAFWGAQDRRVFAQNFHKILTGETCERFKEVFLSLLKGQTSYFGETSIFTFSGELKQIGLKLNVLSGSEESFERVMLAVNDITELKAVQEQLRENQQNLEIKVIRRTHQLQKEVHERRQIEKELRKSRSRLSKQSKALSRLSATMILKDEDLTWTLKRITETCANTLDVERVGVWLFDEEKSAISCIFMFQRSGQVKGRDGYVFKVEEYPKLFRAIKRNQVFDINDAYNAPQVSELLENYLKPRGIRSLLYKPIRLSGKLKGVLSLENVGSTRDWQVDEKYFARTIGEIVALAFEVYERRKAEEQLKFEEKRLEILFRLSQNKHLCEEDLLKVGLKEIVEVTQSHFGFFWLTQNGWQKPEKGILFFKRRSRKVFEIFDGEAFLGVKAWQICAMQGRPMLYTLHRDEAKAFPAEMRKYAFQMCVPVIQEGRVVAVAGIGNSTQPYSESNMQRINLFMNSLWEIMEKRGIEERVQHLAAIVESSEDAIIGHTLSGIITSWNRGAQKLYQYHADEVLGKSIELIVPPERRAELKTILNKIRRGHRVENYETVRIGKDGQKIRVSLTISAIRNAAGKIIGASVIDRDVSKRKQTEELLKKAKIAAERANRLKSEFLATMSHEIRTPLNAIIGLNHLLQITRLTPKQREYLSKMQIASQSLLGLINDILDFSKIEAGRLEVENIDFRIEEIFERLSSIIGLKSRQKEIELIFKIDPRLPVKIKGDPNRIYQILLNLANNAVKFTERGSVIVSARLQRRTRKYVHIVFEVQDSGQGIPPEKQSMIFEAFTQSEASTTRRYGGSGLGLTICKKLVEMMNGEIWVKSTLGQGSTFGFSIHFEYEKKDIVEALRPPMELKGMRVLVVDDNIDLAETLLDQLHALSFQASSVTNGRDAITELQTALTTGKRMYDLVLLDWKLNGESGLIVAQSIRRNTEIAKQPKIILMSGFILSSEIKDEHWKYVDLFLGKPFSISSLFNAILEAFGQEVLDEFKLRADLGNPLSKQKELHGAKVLVVDDNPFNQLVIQDMLENQGVKVEIVTNGLEAVELFENRKNLDFSLVLMDVQMPVMDGYEATRRIRQLEWAKNIPIVALTADVIGGVVKRCLDSGMNDYISKPIDPDELFEKVARLLKRSKSTEQTFEPGHHKNQESPVLFPALLGLDVDAGIRRANFKPELYRRLLSKFSESHQDFVIVFKNAMKENDRSFAIRLAHTLKGTAGTIGADLLYEAAKNLEEKVHEGKKKEINKLLKTVENELTRILKSIEDYLNMYDSPGQKGEVVLMNDQELLEQLQDVSAMLNEFNGDAVSAFEKAYPSLKKRGFEEEADVVQSFLSDYDFVQANSSLQKVIKLLEDSVQ